MAKVSHPMNQTVAERAFVVVRTFLARPVRAIYIPDRVARRTKRQSQYAGDRDEKTRC